MTSRKRTAEAFRILTLNSISSVGLKRLPAGLYVCGGQMHDPDAILVRSHDMHAMDITASVKTIGRAGAGVNNIPVEKMSRRGVPVFNAPGANANAVKELVIAGVLLAARNLVPALRFTSGLEGDDRTLHKLVEEGKKEFSGFELPRHTVGVVGLGKVGSLVADAAIKLGMNVLGYDPHITVDAAWSLPSQVKKAHSVEEVLRASDFVTLHVPLLDVTRKMINHERVKLMKNGAILLNFARDGIVDEDAVLEGLASKRIRYYVSDFPTKKLQGHPHVVALPHLGASTREAEDNSAVMVIDQVRDFLENGNIVNAVNFPDVVMAREAPYRVGIANANVPNMVGQISTAMAKSGLNIHNMLNKSKGEMAYTLVDVDSVVPVKVCEQISSIKGVLSFRYLPQNAVEH
ncbi:MAG TPA: phosphoglycerate dehydrogenase [Burkholderiales bacterium]|nr:phosphoglycerate dehydrogenase [Burkholderiales bacterium]